MVHVRKSTVIDAPIDAVWAALRDFNAHDQWHPEVVHSTVEDSLTADTVGAVRNFTIKAGGRLREQLLSLSDREHTLQYCLLDTPIPLLDYVASIRLKPVTDAAATYWQWESKFRTPPGMEDELAKLVGESIYEAGFEAIRSMLDHDAPASTHADDAVEPASRTALPVPAPALQSRPTAIEARAVVVERHGGPEVLSFKAVSAAPPGPGEVRIRHAAIGVNYIDVYCRTGYFDLLVPPAVPGMEAAGTVIDIGTGIIHLRTGDRVAYATPPVGAYTTVRTLDATRVIRLPDDIDEESAAAVLLKGMTAEFLLHQVHQLKAGETILVHAAAGGVGLLVTQWARALGARVIGTVSSDHKARAARDVGCEYVIVHSRDDFVSAIMEITAGAGVDVVIDGVGESTFDRSFAALAVRGHLISYGQASGDIGDRNISRFAAKSARLSRPNFGHYTDEPHKIRAMSSNLFDAIRRGLIQVRIGQRFPLANAADAHRALENRQTIGSTLLIP